MWRAFAAVGASLLVLAVPADIATSGSIPYAYYGGLFLWLSVYAGLNTVHFVSFMAFYSRVSDADIGGRGLHSFPILLSLSSSVHRIIQLRS